MSQVSSFTATPDHFHLPKEIDVSHKTTIKAVNLEGEIAKADDHFVQLEKFVLENWDCGSINLVSETDLLKSFDRLCDFNCTILKYARWTKDSIILKVVHKTSQRAYAIKVHENSFKTCRRNYHGSNRLALNRCTHLSNVYGAVRIASAKGKFYFAVIYDFVVGSTLDQALLRKDLTNQQAIEGLIDLSLELKREGFNIFLKDRTDFLVTVTKEIVITDWDKMFRTHNTNSVETVESKCKKFVKFMFDEENIT
ncbi:hypothetical protein D5R81_11665 [Parashewanella spongiae]|uniref:Protein kinase domain-containing protein n=1 Tax=Parashewanella spongiae TaxID=342950 RepID=A0A3A6TVK1_9GAMM|nr:hypothetical protein [Parashewanella spongiae]MCL1077604.1 hypothetical protein [Parashewanella spongiae]RJY13168.1 hypothetical protein D5R81_11665 [Parashewanella spongiae]